MPNTVYPLQNALKVRLTRPGIPTSVGPDPIDFSLSGIDYVGYDYTTADVLVIEERGVVEFCVLASGAAGGNHNAQNDAAGGGGAGQWHYFALFLEADVYPILIPSGAPRNTSSNSRGSNGANFEFMGYVIVGGGSGGTATRSPQSTRGSGGGGGVRPSFLNPSQSSPGQPVDPNLGHRGGFANQGANTNLSGGAGGGVGSVGGNGTNSRGGNGGRGKRFNFLPDEFFGLGGGGGKGNNNRSSGNNGGGSGASNSSRNGGDAADNTGSGGGGGRNRGGAGGSARLMARHRKNQ